MKRKVALEFGGSQHVHQKKAKCSKETANMQKSGWDIFPEWWLLGAHLAE